MLESHRLDKDLIFFIPGKPGSVFTYKAGHFVDDAMIQEASEHLDYDVDTKVTWIEDRRTAPRSA